MISHRFEETILRALSIAQDRNHKYTTVEHLLQALTYDEDAIAVLDGCGADLVSLQSNLADFIDHELTSLTSEEIDSTAPSASFQRVIQRASIHVSSSGHDEIYGSNALVALLDEADSRAVYFLSKQNINRLDAENYLRYGISNLIEVPEQDKWLNFKLRDDGTIDLCKKTVDIVKYDERRVSILQPKLIKASERVLRAFTGGIGHNAFSDLVDDIQEYLDAINRPADQIDFCDVWALGVHLQQRVDAAARDIEDRLQPELEDSQRSALGTLLGLHGPFILASLVGQELIEASQRYQGTKEDSVQYREIAEAFSIAVQQNPNFITKPARHRIGLVNQGVGTSRFYDREIITSQLTNRNIICAISFSAVAYIGLSATNGIIENIAAQSIFGKNLIDFGARYADKTYELIKLATNFLIDNEAILLGFAACCPEGFGWLGHLIAWLKERVHAIKK